MMREPPKRTSDAQLGPVPVAGTQLDDSAERLRDLEATRRLLATVIAVGSSATGLVVVIGGIIGRFGPDIIAPVVAGFITCQTAVAYFYFRRNSGRDSDHD